MTHAEPTHVSQLVKYNSEFEKCLLSAFISKLHEQLGQNEICFKIFKILKF